MNSKTMAEALNAIREEAEKILAMALPDKAAAKVELIIATARYQHDVRTQQETDEGNR